MANTRRYREYDLAHLKLIFEFCIYSRLKSVRYGVSKARIRRIFLDGYAVLVVRIVIFKISSFKLQNAHLLLILTKYSTLFDVINVAAAGCCANILWIKSQLTDYDIIYEKVPIFFDNTHAMAISNNPVLHSRTKHIDIRYHFIRDHILKGDIELHFIPTQYQLADIFTKPLDKPTFKRLIVELDMLNIDSKHEASVLTE
ncbi:hypothetical protein Tco_0735448 [Tanacetum coccineum]